MVSGFKGTIYVLPYNRIVYCNCDSFFETIFDLDTPLNFETISKTLYFNKVLFVLLIFLI